MVAATIAKDFAEEFQELFKTEQVIMILIILIYGLIKGLKLIAFHTVEIVNDGEFCVREFSVVVAVKLCENLFWFHFVCFFRANFGKIAHHLFELVKAKAAIIVIIVV